MKKIFTIACVAFLLSLNIKATVRTVNNNGLGGAQYSDIAAAITASSNNDTIYISGSATNYPSFTINKRLTLIGPGSHIGGNTQNTQQAYINGAITIDSTANNNSVMNIKLMGLRFDYLNINHGKNITIERCDGYQISAQNADVNSIFIRGCAFERIINFYYSTNTAIEISNTIFKYTQYLTPNTLVNHCIILGDSYNTSNGGNGTVFTNSIFYNTNFNNGAFTGCVFTNNLVYNVNIAPFTLPLAGCTGNNNQAAVDPLFVNATTGDPSWTDIFAYNWRLQSTSTGHNAASDGADLGVYGGTFAINQIGLLPTIPQVNEININNAAVPQNGTLNLNFKARKEN
jgi:hypothetical protein